MNNLDLHAKGLVSLAGDGLGTPKFKDEDSFADDANITIYKRKRLQIQARKELFALENYRSESCQVPVSSDKAAHHTLENLKTANLQNTDDSTVKKINTLECRVKQVNPKGRGLRGHVKPAHSAKDSMLGGFIAAGPGSSIVD